MDKNLLFVRNDVGYGYGKMVINDEEVLFPSVIAKKQTYLAPNHDSISDEYMENFLSKMDASINSPIIQNSDRLLIGEAAKSSSARKQGFNVFSGKGKSDDDLSPILTLSMLAGARVKEAYNNKEDLTKPLTANVIMATELPIAEGRNKVNQENYVSKYMDHTHVVTFNNFDNPITVTINFLMVECKLEGETASLALSNATTGIKGIPELKKLREVISNYYKKHYPEQEKSYSVDKLIQSENAFIFDIGARTSDLVTTTNDHANPEASDSIDLGFAAVQEKTRQKARIEGLGNFRSRFDLVDFLNRKNLIGANLEKQEKIKQLLEEQTQVLSEDLIDAGSDLLSLTSNTNEVVYVLGGGSIPMAQYSDFLNELQELLKSLNAKCPIIWIDPEIAQWVNEIGLHIVLLLMIEKAKKDGLID